MFVTVSQDPDHPEGGYAVLRFDGVANPVDDARVAFQPLDEGLPDFERWPRGRLPAVASRVRDGTLEVVVGPEVVNLLPADTAIQVGLIGVDPRTGAEVDLRADCRWPSLRLRSDRRRGRLPDVGQTVVVERLTPPPRSASLTPPARARPQETAPAPDTQRDEPPEPPARATAVETPAPVAETPPRPAIETPTPVEEVAAPLQLEPPAPAPSPTPPPRRTGATVGVAALALLLGVGLGGVGGRYVLPPQPPGPSAAEPAPAPAPPAEMTADRRLMAALDSPDVGPDGRSIFRTSQEDFFQMGLEAAAAGDLAAGAERYRMAARVALREQSLPDIVAELLRVLQHEGAAGPDAERTGNLLLTLAALAGDRRAYCELAENYAAGDPDYARRLRDRSRSPEADPSRPAC